MTDEAQSDEFAGVPREEMPRDEWRLLIERRLDNGAVEMRRMAAEIAACRSAVLEAHGCLDAARLELDALQLGQTALHRDLEGVIAWSRRRRWLRTAIAATWRWLSQCVVGGAVSLSGVCKVLAPIVTLALLIWGAWASIRVGAPPPPPIGH